MNLLIDTHLNDIVLITFKDDKIIKTKKVENEKCSSKYVMPLVKKILDKEKLESIIVINGPGSFTGVRLGVTIAKTLAKTMNIPIKTITSLECLALSIPKGKNKIVGFSDNNGYYVAIFEDNMKKVGDYIYLKNNDFEDFNNSYKVETELIIDYNNVIDFCKDIESINPDEVNPIYVKILDVENNDQKSKN